MCCSNCGAKLPKSALFCPNCGAARQSAGGGKPPHRSRLPLWIALGVLALALIVSGLLLAPKLFPRAGESAPTPARPDASESPIARVYAAAAPYQDESGAVSADMAQAAIDAVYAAALESPEILSCEKDAYGVYMEAAEGPDYVYSPQIEDMDLGGGGLQIVTLQPFDAENREKNQRNHWDFDLDAPDTVAKDLARSDIRWNFDRYSDLNDASVSMERLLKLGDNQVILWHGHGGYNERAGYYLCTTIPWSAELRDRFGLDDSTYFRSGENGYLALRPSFFQKMYPDGAFENAFIYLGTCMSGKEPDMAQTLLDKGAAVVFVNSERINRGYNLDMMHLIAESYLVGPGGRVSNAAIQKLGPNITYNTPENWTIRDSLLLAQARYGSKDPSKGGKGAKVFYLCKSGMETCSYITWSSDFALNDVYLPLSAEEQYRLNLQMSDFLSCWSAPAYSQREAGGNEMLAFALNYAQAFCPSEIRSAGDMSVISCDALNRILLQHFGRRISFIDGKNYDPYQAGSSEWACQCRNGELYFPPAGGVYTSFAIAGPLRQMSDGSLEFSFTEYQPLSQDSSSTQYDQYLRMTTEEALLAVSLDQLRVQRAGTVVLSPRPAGSSSLGPYVIREYAQEAESLADGSYYAYIHTLDPDEPSFDLELLELVTYEESFVDSLRVGSPVEEDDLTVSVKEIVTGDKMPIYILEDYCSIFWSPVWEKWILCAPSGASVLRSTGRICLPVQEGIRILDEMQALNTGGDPKRWSLAEIRSRYGEDLQYYTFLLRVEDGVVQEATLLYEP